LVRSADGKVEPFHGEVGGILRRDDGQYQCAFASTAMSGGGMLYGTIPEWVYHQSVAFIRHDLEYRQLALVDEQGRELDFVPPLADAAGRALFPAARFVGWIAYPDGRRESFVADVGDVVPGQLGFDCPVSCSRYPGIGPSRSAWPEQAYELAFMLLRRLLIVDGATLADEGGRPLDLIAPAA
jgi:hypothetical protein